MQHLLQPRIPVSVVIPTYNAADTLPRAIQSVARQSLLPADIVIVDDASTDNTIDVIEQLCATYIELTIRVISLSKNSGPGTARNVGWNASREQYVAFLDSDDTWHPQKLEVQYQWMCRNPDTAICGHICQVWQNQPDIEFVHITNSDSLGYKRLELRSFLFGNQLSTPTVMLARKIQERFLDGKRCSEDYLLWTQIISAHGPAGFIQLPLAFLHKPTYGASGLSGNLWEMQKGEIDSLLRLRQSSVFHLTRIYWFIVIAVSWLKFVKRLFVRLASIAHRSLGWKIRSQKAGSTTER
jgi:glycosyltransferase involved in cell wall biosynthesis